MKVDRRTLSRNLFALADRYRTTAERLAQVAGITDEALHAILCCRRDATAAELDALARAFGVPGDMLVQLRAHDRAHAIEQRQVGDDGVMVFRVADDVISFRSAPPPFSRYPLRMTRDMDMATLVEWIRDCVAVAVRPADDGDVRLHDDAAEELRELFGRVSAANIDALALRHARAGQRLVAVSQHRT